MSIYNPNGTSFLPGHSSLPETGEDIDDHVYASIEDTLVYTHLLRKGKEIGIYGETDTYRPFTGPTEPYNPPASKDSSFDSKQEVQVSSNKPPSVPLRSVSHDRHMVDNVIYQAEGQSEEEHSPTLGPRLEPEGGNWGDDWIQLWFPLYLLELGDIHSLASVWLPHVQPVLFSSGTVWHQVQIWN